MLRLNCHTNVPGGPMVIKAITDALGLDDKEAKSSW